MYVRIVDKLLNSILSKTKRQSKGICFLSCLIYFCTHSNFPLKCATHSATLYRQWHQSYTNYITRIHPPTLSIEKSILKLDFVGFKLLNKFHHRFIQFRSCVSIEPEATVLTFTGFKRTRPEFRAAYPFFSCSV